MNIDRNRIDTLVIEHKFFPIASLHRRLRSLFTPVSYCRYAMLITLTILLCFPGSAMAKPASQTTNPGKIEVPSSPSIREETPSITAGSKSGEGITGKDAKVSSGGEARAGSQVKPGSEPNGKYLIDDYEDPGKPKEKPNFIIQLFYTAIDIVKYIFYFALVIGIGFLAIYGVKIFTTKYNFITGGGHELLNILEIKYLAPGKAICLVEVAGKVLVLGMAGNTINYLSELTEFEQVDALKRSAAMKPEPLQPFQAYLEKFTNRFSSTQKSGPKKPSKREQTIAIDGETHWKDDLKTTGESIGKILEEIRKQDTSRPGSSRPNERRTRGEKDK